MSERETVAVRALTALLQGEPLEHRGGLRAAVIMLGIVPAVYAHCESGPLPRKVAAAASPDAIPWPEAVTAQV